MKKLSRLLLSSLLLIGQSLPLSANAQENTAEIDVSQNLFQAVNAEWLSQAEIPTDSPTVGSFTELTDAIDAQLKEDIEKMQAGELEVPNDQMNALITFYGIASDFDKRDALGAKPLQDYLKELDQINSLNDLYDQYSELTFKGFSLPFAIALSPDLTNTDVYRLTFSEPGLFLPEKSYYDDEATRTQLLDLFTQTSQTTLELLGYSTEEANQLLQDAVAFDALLVPTAMTTEEQADIMNTYHPQNLSDLSDKVTTVPLDQLAKDLVGDPGDTVIITNPTYFEQLDQLLTEENFPLLKSWMTVQAALGNTAFLSEDIRQAGSQFNLMLSGQQETVPQDEAAYNLASSTYADVLGKYYGETYFGPQAKAQATELVEAIVDAVKARLVTNDWLSQDTIDKAVVKLDALTLNVGYPDVIDPIYDKIVFDPELSLFDNYAQLSETLNRDAYAKFDQAVEKGYWVLPAHMVNAMYYPIENAIYIPAAILQAPFFDTEQSDSANYGGIGVVIGHEITHAFDNNGALFDEVGNMANWWTDQDYAAFEEKGKAMVAQWDGLPFADGQVNGQLTLSENIADAGGMASALDAINQLDEVNLEEFFYNYARIWRSVSSPEYDNLLLNLDTHAPNELRVNIPVRNFEAFYDTFSIQEDDAMYMTPADRVTIW